MVRGGLSLDTVDGTTRVVGGMAIGTLVNVILLCATNTLSGGGGVRGIIH